MVTNLRMIEHTTRPWGIDKARERSCWGFSAAMLVALWPALVWPMAAADAATYYVAPSGEDSAAGTALSTPWRSLKKIRNFPFQPGDQVLFQRGATWQGVLIVQRSGAAGAPIAYGAFGDGAAPIIHGTKDHAARILKTAHIEIRDLHFTGAARIAVQVRGARHLLIENCTIGPTPGYGIRVTSAGDRISSDGVIRGCHIDSGRRAFEGRKGGPDGIVLYDGVENFRVAGNTIRAFPHTGIAVQVIHQDKPVAFNEVYDNIIVGSDMDYMRGFSVIGKDNLVHDNIVYNNKIKDMTQPSHVGGNNNQVYYNIFDSMRDYGHTANSGVAVDLGSFDGGRFGGVMACRDNLVYNNVFYNIPNEGIKMVGAVETDAQITGNRIFNNILLQTGGLAVLRYPSAGNSYQANVVFPPGGFRHRSGPLGASEFNQRNGAQGDLMADNMDADPQLTAPESGDFRPRADSPAIDAGIPHAVTTDHGGGAVPHGQGVDAGAFEFAGDASPGP